MTLTDCAEEMGLQIMTFKNRLIKNVMELGVNIPQFKEGRKTQSDRDWAKVKNNSTAVIPKQFLEKLGVKPNDKLSFEVADMEGVKIIAVSVKVEGDSNEGDSE